MCDELEGELQEGQLAVTALVEHVARMGIPSKVTMPVEYGGHEWVVTVERVLKAA